ncbi:hypothetical protein WN51_10296 [Melipona quadrifasciata]|uniref:Ig-like domain-containing protein n=1 Tax=Melipona quadrifasciata TaxID=166423 RepID=A0A0M9A623_9HYME|nr:hypothetical protein WN51_10296 [Melipona quadrifasciata]
MSQPKPKCLDYSSPIHRQQLSPGTSSKSTAFCLIFRRGDELHLLTIGLDTYASDSRFSLALEKPNDWRLLLRSATERDGGVYECQVSAHPPLIRTVYLTVSVGGSWRKKLNFRLAFLSEIQDLDNII